MRRLTNSDRLFSALTLLGKKRRILALKGMGFFHNDNKYRYELVEDGEVNSWVNDEVLEGM